MPFLENPDFVRRKDQPENLKAVTKGGLLYGDLVGLSESPSHEASY
jgi:hypothetical protein